MHLDFLVLPFQILACLMAGFALLALGQSRLFALLRLYAWQSAALALAVAWIAVARGEWHLLVTAVLTLGLKTIYIPRLFRRTVASSHAEKRIQAYVRPATQLCLGLLLVGAAVGLAEVTGPWPFSSLVFLITGLSTALIGLLLLVVRRGLYGQAIGFLMMENGIFACGIGLIGGLPLVTELGMFFDLLVGALLMASLSYQVQQEYGTVVTDRLNELVD